MDLHLRLLAFARKKARLSMFYILEIFARYGTIPLHIIMQCSCLKSITIALGYIYENSEELVRESYRLLR